MKILLLDNYDSFTYNLLHAVKELGATDIEVVRNDQIGLDNVERFDKIILSPGPGIPEEAGLLLPIIKKYAATKSILGVCLGHQVLGHCCGAVVEKGSRPMHGKVTGIRNNGTGLFEGLPEKFKVTRYHSLVVREDSIPREYRIDAVAEDGAVMGISHREIPLYGVQFHPEAVLTEYGHELLENFCCIAEKFNKNE